VVVNGTFETAALTIRVPSCSATRILQARPGEGFGRLARLTAVKEAIATGATRRLPTKENSPWDLM